ncbi:MAG: tyrosine-type recombinase/integrase, partial [Cupriavidus necator]
MASFRKRGELQWQARISRKWYPPQVKTFNTRGDAEAWARLIESEMDRCVFVSRTEAENTSLFEALSRYEREILPGKKGASPESSVLRVWQATDLSNRPMAGVRSADVAKLRDEWLKDRKPATVLRRLAVLSHVFNIARKEWGMESLSNPVELVRKPQPNNARTRRIAAGDPAAVPDEDDAASDRGAQDGELERVIAASGSTLLPSIVCLAIETAMRRGEIISLRWEHVDLKRRVAHLPATKNGSARDVPLSSRAVAVLQALKEARD